MLTKIIKIFTSIILIILPFMTGMSIAKYSPYIEGNDFITYVWIWGITSMVVAGASLLLIKYLFQSVGRLFSTQVLLFSLVVPILGIVGLASAPDLTINLLQHPEREHFRYILLLLAATIFGISFLLFFANTEIEWTTTLRRMMIVLFIFAFAELLYELTHHYLYPEGLQAWVDQGNKLEDFGKAYDNFLVITIGCIGRFFQFTLIALFAFRLYKIRNVKIWSPVISFIFCILGIISSATVYFTHMSLPKGFEFLFLFFIPGIPFLVLYWIGVAWLTKDK